MRGSSYLTGGGRGRGGCPPYISNATGSTRVVTLRKDDVCAALCLVVDGRGFKRPQWDQGAALRVTFLPVWVAQRK